jgi:hypothetical protein
MGGASGRWHTGEMNKSHERIATPKERMASVFTRVERCQREIEDYSWMAQRSKAAACEISASHVPFLSHPDEVARTILQAANEAVPA